MIYMVSGGCSLLETGLPAAPARLCSTLPEIEEAGSRPAGGRGTCKEAYNDATDIME